MPILAHFAARLDWMVRRSSTRKAAYDALCRVGGSTARNSMPCRLIVGHIPKWLPPNTLTRTISARKGRSNRRHNSHRGEPLHEISMPTRPSC